MMALKVMKMCLMVTVW